MEVAHLSDVHVGWRPGECAPWYRFLNKRMLGGLNLLLHRSHPVELLEAAVQDLRDDPPDHLCVTGDLTNLATEAEFLWARELLERTKLPAERISVIPGNHDTYTRGSYRQRRFEDVFDDWIGGRDVVWPRAQRRDGVLFASTTSSIPTPWFTAYGRMGEPQLAALGELLDEEADYKVVLVHHPPLQGDGHPDRVWRRNQDGRLLIELCRSKGVGLILCGHTHKAFRWEVPGDSPLTIHCAGSTTRPPTPRYNRYRIEGGRLASVEVRTFDPELGAFLRTGSPG